MRRTKLVYVVGKDITLEEKIQKYLKQYKIQKEDIIDIRYSESEGTQRALIIYEAKP